MRTLLACCCVLCCVLGLAPLACADPMDHAALDRNGDGGVTLAELKAQWEAAGAHLVIFRVEDVDADSDGAVTWEELRVYFPAALELAFAKADEDADGALSPAETKLLLTPVPQDDATAADQ